MRKSNYDKMPATVVDGTLWKGWESIRKRLAEIHAETNGSQVWVVECYQGVLSIREIYLNRQKI